MEIFLAPYGLTTAQFDVIQHLLDQDGLDHRALQEMLGIASPTLTRTLDELAAMEYIERRQHPDDARMKQIFLAPKAVELHHRLADAGDQFTEVALHNLTETERTQFLRHLETLVDNLDTAYEQQHAQANRMNSAAAR